VRAERPAGRGQARVMAQARRSLSSDRLYIFTVPRESPGTKPHRRAGRAGGQQGERPWLDQQARPAHPTHPAARYRAGAWKQAASVSPTGQDCPLPRAAQRRGAAFPRGGVRPHNPPANGPVGLALPWFVAATGRMTKASTGTPPSNAWSKRQPSEPAPTKGSASG
jgi:hypothetical protein